MGRPINKKYFIRRGVVPQDVVGQGVASVTLANTGTEYTASTTTSLTFSAPQLVGGVSATGNATTNSSGNIASVNLLTAGSGYTSVPTVLVTLSTTGTAATFSVALATPLSVTGNIQVSAYIPNGSSAKAAEIIKQEASHRYLVETSDGIGQCKLATTSTLTAGLMNIIATDANGSTYFVQKLTARRAVLIQKTVNGSFAFASGSVAKWSIGSASVGTVSIAHS
jgi:hypothetical protein